MTQAQRENHIFHALSELYFGLLVFPQRPFGSL